MRRAAPQPPPLQFSFYASDVPHTTAYRWTCNKTGLLPTRLPRLIYTKFSIVIFITDIHFYSISYCPPHGTALTKASSKIDPPGLLAIDTSDQIVRRVQGLGFKRNVQLYASDIFSLCSQYTISLVPRCHLV